MSEESDWENYESGPFCEHWHDPGDCDEVCANCGHKCHEHTDGMFCEVNDCKCEEFKDE